MPLSDLASLVGTTPSRTNTKTGYDGKPINLKVSLDSKARKGKTVTRIAGFQSRGAELEELATTLKKLCGSGGTVGDNCIDIQGDHREKVSKKLVELGYKTKVV